MARLGREVLRLTAPGVLHWSLCPGTTLPSLESILPALRSAYQVRRPEGEVPLRLRLATAVAADFDAAVRAYRGALFRLTEPSRNDPAGSTTSAASTVAWRRAGGWRRWG